MTKQECAVVMAYTGVCMLTGDDLKYFYDYVRQIFGRSVMTHELGNGKTADAIKEKAKPDFEKLCRTATVTTAEPLKPCPFCGAQPEVIKANNHSYFIACENTACPANSCAHGDSEIEAVEKWNRRKTHEKLGRMDCIDDDMNVYRCSACGNEWILEEGTPEENNYNFCPNCGVRIYPVDQEGGAE